MGDADHAGEGGMSFQSDGQSISRYQDATEKHKAMAGCSFSSFMCPVCGKSKRVIGRVSRGYKRGFRCADCEAARIARKAK